jgi:hypothetical protein
METHNKTKTKRKKETKRKNEPSHYHTITMCIICDCKGDYSSLQGTDTIDCNMCIAITAIPNIIGLKTLLCDGCFSITTIYPIQGLKTLNCNACMELTAIPLIEGLKQLNCNGCFSITTIPNIKGLKKLYCCGCSLLTSIADIEGLQELWCSGCRSLTSIPTKDLTNALCNNCPWISYNNDEYKQNIRKLITLQRRTRNKIRYKTFCKWIKTEQFAQWFYHPRRLGGLIAKQNLRCFTNTLQK